MFFACKINFCDLKDLLIFEIFTPKDESNSKKKECIS